MGKRKSEYSPFKLLCEELRLKHSPPLTLTEMAEQLPYRGKRGKPRQKSTEQSQLSSFENGRNHSLDQVACYARFFYPDEKKLPHKEKNEGIFSLFETALLSSDVIDISNMPPQLKSVLVKLAAAFLLRADIAETDFPPGIIGKIGGSPKIKLTNLSSVIQEYADLIKQLDLSYKTEEY